MCDLRGMIYEVRFTIYEVRIGTEDCGFLILELACPLQAGDLEHGIWNMGFGI